MLKGFYEIFAQWHKKKQKQKELATLALREGIMLHS